MSMDYSLLSMAAIRAALIGEFGKPFDTLDLRHAGESKDVPTAIDVLFFEPDPAEGCPEEEWYTYLLTCGLATHPLSGPIERFELVMSVRRRVPREDRHRLARRLAELGTSPFREPFELHPELVLSGVSLPLFERRTHVVLSLYRGEEYLPTRPAVALLHVTPVFEREAEQIRRLSVSEAFFRFSVAGIKRDDPDRPEVDLESIAPLPSAVPAPHPSPMPTIDQLWSQLESRLGPEAGLRKPATEQSIRSFLDYVGDDVPESYLVSLRRHDGAADLIGYELLSLERLLEVRRGLLEQLHGEAFAGRSPQPSVVASRRIEPDWWNAAWIPFAAHRSGRLLFIDLFPGRHGTEGQILEWDPTEGPLGVTHDSFEAWLQARLDELSHAPDNSPS